MGKEIDLGKVSRIGKNIYWVKAYRGLGFGKYPKERNSNFLYALFLLERREVWK